jgi:hypothetical protein
MIDPIWKAVDNSGSRIYHIIVNKVLIGTAEPTMSGTYEYFPIARDGYIPSWLLKAIAKGIDELNTPYEEELARYFKEEKDGGSES